MVCAWGASGGVDSQLRSLCAPKRASKQNRAHGRACECAPTYGANLRTCELAPRRSRRVRNSRGDHRDPGGFAKSRGRYDILLRCSPGASPPWPQGGQAGRKPPVFGWRRLASIGHKSLRPLALGVRRRTGRRSPPCRDAWEAWARWPTSRPGRGRCICHPPGSGRGGGRPSLPSAGVPSAVCPGARPSLVVPGVVVPGAVDGQGVGASGCRPGCTVRPRPRFPAGLHLAGGA